MMSAKAMGRAWDLKITKPQRAVLLAMADHADHEGNSIRPGIPLIAWKTDYSQPQTRRIIQSLVEARILVLVSTPKGKPKEYRFDLEAGEVKKPRRQKRLTPLPQMIGVTGNGQGDSENQTPIIAVIGGDSHSYDRGTPITQMIGEPSLEPSLTINSVSGETEAPSVPGKIIPLNVGQGEPPQVPPPPPLRPRNLLFDAVARYIFETDLTQTEGIDENAGRIGAITAWLGRKTDGINRGKNKLTLGYISRAAEPRHVIQFAEDWKVENPKANLPLDFEKFVTAWRRWASGLVAQSQNPTHQRADTQDDIPLTADEQAEIAAIQLEAGR